MPSMMPSGTSASISLMFPVSMKSFISVLLAPLRGRLRTRDDGEADGIGQLADAFDFYRDTISGSDGPNPRRRAGRDDVAGQQRHHRRDERDQSGNSENQLPRGR